MLASLHLSAQKPADNILISEFNFESKATTQTWKSENGSTAISSSHFKDGKNALLWNYSPGDHLVVSEMKGLNESTKAYKGGIPEMYEPAYYPEGKFGGIKMWLYQEKPQTGHIDISNR